MKYLMLHYLDEAVSAILPEDTVLDAWVTQAERSGVKVDGGRLRPVSDATTVRVRGGEVLVTDGPYAETKEQIAGFDVIECAGRDEAIEIAAGHPTAKVGTFELRPFWI